jgi:hypothetical protein
MKYKIGDRVKTKITDREGVVIAVDDLANEFAKVKVKFNGFFANSSWMFESMLTRILTKDA